MSTARRQLWLPVLALLLIGGAVTFALTHEWTAPPPAVDDGRRPEARKPAARGETATLPAGADPTTPGDGGTATEPPDPEPLPAPEGVEAPEGEGIVGILVDGEGNPVSRASIRIRPTARRPGRGAPNSIQIGNGGVFLGGKQAGVTDRHGRFAIREPGGDGTYAVSFTHEDHAPHSETDIAWTGGSRVDLGVVRMPDGGTIFGFVRDGSGHPVSGARVWRTEERRAGGAIATSSVRFVVSGDVQVVSFGGNRGEMTDAEGYFEMTKVAPGTYDLHARGEDTAESLREDLVVVEGGRTGPVTLTTTEGLEIHGTVVDESGQPVARAMVHGSQPGGGFRPTRTDEDGVFVLRNLAAGKVRLTATGRGMWGSGPRATAQVEAGTSGVRLVLEEGLTLGGRVVDQLSGAPVSGVRVLLEQKTEGGSRRRMSVVTNGVFRFANLEPGDYTIEFSGGGYAKQTEGPHTLVEGRSVEDLLVRLRKE